MFRFADHVGERDLVFMTLDTLRYDVAARELGAGRTPHLQQLLGDWERRHSPATFTYAAHQAFFAGFLPTPARPGRHERLFAADFPGSETTGPDTFRFPEATVVEALKRHGYTTVCIGGVGFFNQLTPLGRVLPSLFDVAEWSPELGVTCRSSMANQVAAALPHLTRSERVFLFINVSALHQPNHFYLDDSGGRDSVATQAAALRYVDSCLPRLIDAVRSRGPSAWIVCSDHGTAYGEDGFVGHRLAHEVVTSVPYADCLLD